LCGLEGHGRIPPALRAGRRGFGFGETSPGPSSLPLGLAPLAALRLILEILIVEKVLLSGREDEIRSTVDAFEDSVLELRHIRPVFNLNCTLPDLNTRKERLSPLLFFLLRLLDLAARLLAVPLARQRLLGPQFFSRLQVEGVSLDLLDDVLLLDLSLEAAKGVIERLALLQSHFSQSKYTSQPDPDFPTTGTKLSPAVQKVLIS
jgi:hypothetical protein